MTLTERVFAATIVVLIRSAAYGCFVYAAHMVLK
jgi:hypothetical protein